MALSSAGAFYSPILNSWCISEGLHSRLKGVIELTGLYQSSGIHKSVDEKEYSAILYEDLSRYFVIEPKVHGKHIAGQRLEIDWVLTPKCIEGWPPDIAFGIELKHKDKLASNNYHTYWAKQAIDYSYTKWDRYGYLPVLMGPQSDILFNKEGREIKELLHAFNIGYCSIENGFQIYSAGELLWCQIDGVQEIARLSSLLSIKPYGLADNDL